MGQIVEQIQLFIKNNSTEQKSVSLFGYNDFKDHDNYGSDEEVSITTDNRDITYSEFFKNLENKEFVIDGIKIISFNKRQITQVISVRNKDGNGDVIWMPIIIQSYISANQINNNVIDVNSFEIKAHNDMWMQFPILGNTEVTMIFDIKN